MLMMLLLLLLVVGQRIDWRRRTLRVLSVGRARVESALVAVVVTSWHWRRQLIQRVVGRRRRGGRQRVGRHGRRVVGDRVGRIEHGPARLLLLLLWLMVNLVLIVHLG